MLESHITLAHGNGGRFMRDLIDGLFVKHLHNPHLDTRLDAVAIAMEKPGELMVTTDGFIVHPLEFPGGDIGSLAVHGTVNDLAVAGAVPVYLTLACFLEEGLETAVLERILLSMARAATESGVQVVAGDTKVVPRGKGGGVYFSTTGIGRRVPGVTLGMDRICPGDKIVVSGPVGDHGTAVMLAREAFGLSGELRSDSGPVLASAQVLMGVPGLRFMRDPTRGGLATVIHEMAAVSGLTARIRESAIPVRDPVRAVCEILGFDPLYLACEGRLVAVVAADAADRALETLQHKGGAPQAAMIGEFREGRAVAVLETELGGERVLQELEDDPLPRIC